jgi:SAM-dependent methyltransferase
VRGHGLQFDEVAEAYEKHRPSYPAELIDSACSAAGLTPGDPVLEVGCGTGKLTTAMVRRGLSVLAVEPGANMIELARGAIAPCEAQFVKARFEDAELPSVQFAAVFSAAAFHWVDPAVGWAKAAATLRAQGSLVLMGYCGVSEELTEAHEAELMRALERVAPEIAATLPSSRDSETILSGALERRRNVSEVWSWVTQYELGTPAAADLFSEVEVLTSRHCRRQTAEEINSLLRTTSLAFRIGPERMAALEAENERIVDAAGGHIPLVSLFVAAIARRA